MTPDMSVWTGRVDAADGPSAVRWHQKVGPLTPGCQSGVVLVGFMCDEGVRRNGGRVGAKDGPRAIRSALANLAWQEAGPVYDAGDVRCDDADMEGAQSRLAEVVAGLVADGHRPLVLGGGHETAWGTFQGLVAAKPDATVGVINVDAHLDLRADEPGNSGTPFLQMARWCAANGRPFRYLCLGVAAPANTPALLRRAMDLNAETVADTGLAPWRLDRALAAAAAFAGGVDLVHLSLDLDVLPAATMPAVSAPAGYGVPLESVDLLVRHVLATRKVAALDVVELNPALDPDGNGGRVAARLAWTAALTWNCCR
ncbi:MAG: formimidoylglutamase [Isosphaera sp.]|nr:formimidoylglutamase [Isosphaera sp.]